MRKLVAFLCSGLAATLGFANDGVTDTSTDTTADTTTPLCVGFSFNNNKGGEDSGTATSAIKDTSGVVVGTDEALEETEWFYSDPQNSPNGNISNIFPFTVEDADTTTPPTITWSSKNGYYRSGSTFLDGYLDDGNGISINVTGFTNRYVSTDYKYDVIIYFSTDSSSRAFTAPTVNGKRYTYDSDNPSTAKEGSASFGNSSHLAAGKAQYGVNALRIRGLTGDLTISNTGAWNSLRGCIAAFQILPAATTTEHVLTIGGEGKQDVNWSEATDYWTPDSNPAWDDPIRVALEGNATLALDADPNIVAMTVTNTVPDTDYTLTLKKTDETITTTIGAIYASDGVNLTVADTNTYKLVVALAAYPEPLTVKAKIDSSDLPFASVSAGRIFAGGAGSESDPRTFACSGGSITLTGETPFYIGPGVYSGTSTTVNYTNATVIYKGADTNVDGDKVGLFALGTANYILTDSTVEAGSFWLSQGANGRPATITLNGSSTLSVSGTTNADSNSSDVMFGHWPGNTTFTLNDDAQFLASSDVLVGKTENSHTINVNGGLFSAKGIILAGNASGTNKLNIDGGTLALGATGINTYSSSRTMAVNVTGDATLRATEVRFPFTEAVTVAADKTLTLDKTNTLNAATYTFGKTISGDGTLAIKSGVNVNFGTARPSNITVEGTTSTLSFKQAYDGEQITISGSFADDLADSNFILYNSSGTQIDARITKSEDGTSIVLEKAIPILTVSSASVNFSDTTLWSHTGDGSVPPTSGEILINNTSGADVTINVANAYRFTKVNIQSANAAVSFAFGEDGDLFSGVTDGVVAIGPSTATLVVKASESPYTKTISGTGKVKTIGDVQFTKNSSFTGGLTVTSGTVSVASAAAKKGFGGVDSDWAAGAITVEDGGCVDLANTANRCYAFTITGKGVATTDESGTTTYSGAIKNSGSSISKESAQTRSITLAGDALITANSGSNWGILAGGYGATTLNFAGYTLTKQGDGEFFLCNTSSSGATGAIAVKEGTLSTFKNASTLSGSSIRMFGNSTLSLGVALNGLASLVLYPAVGGVTLTSLGNLASSTTITLKGSYLDGNDIEAGAETVTLITGSSGTITESRIASSNITLGGRFSGVNYNDTTLTATLRSFPTKFFHFDFNGATMTKDATKADDSVYNINNWCYWNQGDKASPDDGNTIKSSGRTGSSTWVRSGVTRYWTGTTASTSPLDSCGVMTVTTVARLKFATGASAPIWSLGRGTINNTSVTIFLRVVDATTVAAVAFDGDGLTTGRELARVTGIKNLATQYHFFALVITPETTRLYVDRMEPVTEKGRGVLWGSMLAYGQLGAIQGGSSAYGSVNATGYYLDDFQVYDAALSDTEIQALRREFCPDPFFILVK